MAQRQPININFAEGLDTKSDPKQLSIGKFLSLQNSVFTKARLLGKRNGYGPLTALPDTTSTYLTTFGGNLTAIGTKLQAFSQGPKQWVNKGTFQPISFSQVPVVRSALNQTQADAVVATNGLVCTVFTEVNNSVASYKYVIQDSVTGQNIIAPTLIPVSSGTVTGSPRVFLLGGYFIIVFTNVITAVSHLQYIAVSTNMPTVVTANADIASSYVAKTTLSWDGVVFGSALYIAYDTLAGGQQVAITSLNTSFVVAAPQSFIGSIATIMSMSADIESGLAIIYAAFYDLASTTGFVVAVDQNLNQVMTATQIISSGTVNNITCTAQGGICTVAYENAATYSYDANIATNFLASVSVTRPNTVTTGTVGPTTTFLRSVGLASKAFLINGVMYMLTAYDGKSTTVAAFQPTYFMVNLSGNVVARFAYQNGGGYLTVGLPQAQVVGVSVNVAYLFKDLIQSINTQGGLNSAGLAASPGGIYSQTGVNLATLAFNASTLSISELGKNLNLSGGMLMSYDGNTINEQDFNLFPDSIEATWSTTGGNIQAQPDGATNTNAYFYQVIYQWTDAQGNIFNSAPSIPISVTTTGTGTTGSITIHGPNMRLTYKTGVKIIIFRWSVHQQNYYQVTSIPAPLLNSTTTDSFTFVDTLADSAIIGNSLIYTTGGVIPDFGGPASTAITIFDTRLWLIDAEDQNLLWYSKQVIEGTPVEMSDLFTLFIAPNAGASTNTGPMHCLAPMDDKLIIFKANAIYYINGTGPDNTGANNQFSQPIFITSTVGSVNQNSIVLMDNGLMFQSDKGIWLLGRNLATTYIGAPVEAFNSATVNSAVVVPGTTQVRFTLSTGITLMYDYFYGQWGTFVGVPAVSSTIYNNLHTYINSIGGVAQETPGIYLDNGNPVLMQFTTGWINPAGLQGYLGASEFYFLGEYFSPHKVVTEIAYDYNSAPQQLTVITPTNASPAYGQPSPFGQGTPFGGPTSVEQWRVHLTKHRCEAFQISVQEQFDSTLGIPAGAGFTMSGLDLVVALRKGWRPISSAHSAGGQQ